jgi:hypothetical protein
LSFASIYKDDENLAHKPDNQEMMVITLKAWKLLTPLAALALAVCLTLTAAQATPSPQTDAPDLAAIDAYITTEMKAQRIPGLRLGLKGFFPTPHTHPLAGDNPPGWMIDWV